jgi:hypothetical protein
VSPRTIPLRGAEAGEEGVRLLALAAHVDPEHVGDGDARPAGEGEHPLREHRVPLPQRLETVEEGEDQHRRQVAGEDGEGHGRGRED